MKRNFKICSEAEEKEQALEVLDQLFDKFRPGVSTCLLPCKLTLAKTYVYSQQSVVKYFQIFKGLYIDLRIYIYWSFQFRPNIFKFLIFSEFTPKKGLKIL